MPWDEAGRDLGCLIHSDRDQRLRMLDIAGAAGLLPEIEDELADTQPRVAPTAHLVRPARLGTGGALTLTPNRREQLVPDEATPHCVGSAPYASSSPRTLPPSPWPETVRRGVSAVP